jgi:hypothetical protein
MNIIMVMTMMMSTAVNMVTSMIRTTSQPFAMPAANP